jgi:hypothetical protein
MTNSIIKNMNFKIEENIFDRKNHDSFFDSLFKG